MAFDWTKLNAGPKAYSEYKGSMENYQKKDDNGRGLLDRVFDALQIGGYASSGALYNMTDNNPETSALEGIKSGIQAGNPFGEGNEDGEKIFSDVLGNVGWNPESMSGKIAKGAVGLAGDIFLDPLSYVNPISAASKVVGGTGKVAKGFKLPLISLDDAEKAVKASYEKVGVKLDSVPKDFLDREIANLQSGMNEKMMKVRSVGEDFQIGGKNLPFASKIKVPGEKTLDQFTIKLVEAKKLRELGDKTIAPYYNGLVNRVKDTKMIRKFRKDMDIYDMAKTDPVRAASMYRLKELTKGISGVATDRDINVLLESNIIADLYNNLEDATDFVKRYESGEFAQQMKTQGFIAKKADKIKGVSTNSEKIKTQDKIVKKTYEVLKKQIEEGVLPSKNYVSVDTIPDILKVMDDDIADKLISSSMLTEFDEVDNIYKTSDPLASETNDIIRDIARKLNIDGYDDLEKSFESSFDNAISSKKDNIGVYSGGDLFHNTDSVQDFESVLNKKIEDIKSMFLTDGKYHKEFVEEFAKSQISKSGIAFDKTSFNIKNIIDEGKFNTSKYSPESKVEFIKQINDNYFNKLDFLPKTISDDVVDDLVAAFKSGNQDEVTAIMSDIQLGRKLSVDLFDAMTQRMNAKYGLAFKKPSAYWSENVNGKTVRHTVRLSELPKYADEYIEASKGKIKLEEEIADLRTTLSEIIKTGKEQQIFRKNEFAISKLNNEASNYGEQIDNLQTIMNRLNLNKLPRKEKLDKLLKKVNNKSNNIQKLQNVEPIEREILLKQAKSILGDISKKQRVIRDMSKIKSQRIMIEEATKAIGGKNISELATFDSTKLEKYASAIRESAINHYNKINGSKIGYEWADDVDLTDHKMLRDMESFNMEKSNPEALLEKGIDSSKPLSETLTYDQWKLAEFKRKQKIAAQLLNPVDYKNIIPTDKEVAGFLQGPTKQNIGEQITEEITPKTTAISYLSKDPSAIKTYKGGTEVDNVEIKILKEIKEATEESLPSDIPLGKDEVATSLYNYINNRMSRIGSKEVFYGKLGKKAFEKNTGKYIPHVRTQEAIDYIKEHAPELYDSNGGFNPQTFAVGYEKTFNKNRVFKSIEEANRVMNNKTGVEKWFENDLVKAIEVRSLAHNNLIYNEDMVKAVRSIAGEDFEFGKKIPGMTAVVSFVDLNNALIKMFNGKIPDTFFDYINEGVDESMQIKKAFFSPNNGYIPVTDEQVKRIIESIKTNKNAGEKFRGLNVFNLDDTMVKRLNRESQIQKRLHTKDFLNTYDKWLSVYKNLNTTIMPGFHAQNALSNEFQMYLADGANVLDPRKLKNAAEIYTNKYPDKIIKLGKIDLTHRQIKELAEKYGILDNTFFKEDLRFGTDAKGVGAKYGLSGKMDPTDLNQFAPYRVGAKVGSSIEGSQRLVLFIEELKRGTSMKEAVDKVNKYMFDYGDLTDFEKDTMKRIIPFYTFMRKNIPMELNEMIENPNKFRIVDKAFDEVEGMSGDERVLDSQRTPWRKDHVQMPFKLDGQKFGINPQLPYQQLDRLTPGKILGQTTPVIKSPLEILTGKYAYSGMKIDSPVDYAASQFAPTKIINQQADKEGIEKILYLLGQINGFPSGTL